MAGTEGEKSGGSVEEKKEQKQKVENKMFSTP